MRPEARIRLVGLDTIAPERIIALHTNPEVLRHLPLAPDAFGPEACEAWISEKVGQWHTHGFGPWAILVDDEFAGWGGFQREAGDADLALVMFPEHWGMGPAICRRMIAIGFDELKLNRITALLPDSRTRDRAMARHGFTRSGERFIGAHRFARFVLECPG